MWPGPELRHQCEITARLVGHLGVKERRVGERRRMRHEHRVSVWFRPGHGLRRKHAGRSRLVFDDDGLPHALAHVFGQASGQGIYAATRRGRYHESDRPARIVCDAQRAAGECGGGKNGFEIHGRASFNRRTMYAVSPFPPGLPMVFAVVTRVSALLASSQCAQAIWAAGCA
jgi:hypothetical protein